MCCKNSSACEGMTGASSYICRCSDRAPPQPLLLQPLLRFEAVPSIGTAGYGIRAWTVSVPAKLHENSMPGVVGNVAACSACLSVTGTRLPASVLWMTPSHFVVFRSCIVGCSAFPSPRLLPKSVELKEKGLLRHHRCACPRDWNRRLPVAYCACRNGDAHEMKLYHLNVWPRFPPAFLDRVPIEFRLPVMLRRAYP